MKNLKISLKQKKVKTNIVIGSDIMEKIHDIIHISRFSSVYVITDSNVEKLYLKKLIKIFQAQNKMINIHSTSFIAGEKSKNISTVVEIYKDMAKNHIDRESLVVNIGGGVVTDLGGFVASTFMRGLRFVNIPTTLEAMVDASIGGKTGINLTSLKNYIGVIAHPEIVLVDVDFLKTLPNRAFIQGIAEVLKHGLIADAQYFSDILKHDLRSCDSAILEHIIFRSLQIKSHIVEEDEREEGIRKNLNFGHTIGHAIESLCINSKNPLFHGEAVAIGMVAEAKISELKGYISNTKFKAIESGIESVNLPIRISVRPDKIAKLIITDKKNHSGTIRWTLLKRIGCAEHDIEVEGELITKAIAYITRL